ncbi:PREDICTED: ena/VASP-like protein [Nicotiana attenuata]|uniref:ena/VASP-like protein n=1 Tax=Nicotiana attenuata TaxID=49451 RepID=UPI000905BF31|nr:PREDICTED: ena/VASP-like protein [Nicotiana attenuata]
MTNSQDNPGTPPPVSPNTSSSTPPSEPPKPRFRRQKMLARKTVASGSLRKVLNEKLQASQRKEVTTKESDSSSESEKFISASEGEEPGKIRKRKKGKVLAICGSGEEGGMKSGGKWSGEAAEGLINLSEQPDEPGSSVEETLADMLRKLKPVMILRNARPPHKGPLLRPNQLRRAKFHHLSLLHLGVEPQEVG